MLGAVGEVELQWSGHVAFQVVDEAICVALGVVDDRASDGVGLYFVFKSQTVSVVHQAVQIAVDGCVGEVHLGFVLGVDQVEPAAVLGAGFALDKGFFGDGQHKRAIRGKLAVGMVDEINAEVAARFGDGRVTAPHNHQQQSGEQGANLRGVHRRG